jgi:hypothetical protein
MADIDRQIAEADFPAIPNSRLPQAIQVAALSA